MPYELAGLHDGLRGGEEDPSLAHQVPLLLVDMATRGQSAVVVMVVHMWDKHRKFYTVEQKKLGQVIKVCEGSRVMALVSNDTVYFVVLVITNVGNG